MAGSLQLARGQATLQTGIRKSCRRVAAGTLAFTFSLLVSTSVWAGKDSYTVDDLPVLEQESQHSTASKRVTSRFTRSHYRSVPLDDELSSQIFDRYIDQLDPGRNLFLKSDIDQLTKYRLEFDDQLVTGRLSGAYEIYSLNLLRRFERFQYALKLLEQDSLYDFNVKGDKYHFDRLESPHPITYTELDELWRQRVKNDALNLHLADKSNDEIKELLTKRYRAALLRLTQTQSEDVFQAVMNAYARSIEPHTSYLSPRNADRFRTEMNLSLEGIGAVLQMEEDYTVIRSLVPGGPAALSKQLNPKDRIVGVAQADGDFVDIIGWRLDDVVDLIKGPKGTEVRLQVIADKGTATREVTIIRDKVRLEDRAAKSEVLEIDGKKVGVIDIPSFYVDLSQDVKAELQSLKSKNISALIIDLRGNGGGALTEATLLTGLFIESGPVVQVRDSLGRINVKSDSDGMTYYDGPMIVMVDRYSASASEIFAAALQDHGRALVVGEQTYGKGTVQQHRSESRIYDLYEKPIGHVQYTIAKFYRVNGGSTQHKGVIPDIKFPTAVDPEETGESIEDNALPWDRIKKAQYQEIGDFTEVKDWLEQRHLVRITEEPEFDYLFEDIERYKQNKDKQFLSLEASVRESERKLEEQIELNRYNERSRRANKPTVTSLDDVDEGFEVKDFFREEAAQIALDLATKNG